MSAYSNDVEAFRADEKRQNHPMADWLAGDQQAESRARLAWYQRQFEKLVSMAVDEQKARDVWRRMERLEGARVPTSANLERFRQLLLANNLMTASKANSVDIAFVAPWRAAVIEAERAAETELRDTMQALIEGSKDPARARQIYNGLGDYLSWHKLAKFSDMLVKQNLFDGEIPKMESAK